MKAPTSGLKRRQRRARRILLATPLIALVAAITFALYPRHHFDMTACAINACLPAHSYIASLDTYVGPWPLKTECALQETYTNTRGTATDRTHCRVSTRHLLSTAWPYSYFEHITPPLSGSAYFHNLWRK